MTAGCARCGSEGERVVVALASVVDDRGSTALTVCSRCLDALTADRCRGCGEPIRGKGGAEVVFHASEHAPVPLCGDCRSRWIDRAARLREVVA